ELGSAAHILVHEESLRDRRWIGEARGLDDNRIELALPPYQVVENANEIAAHSAANTAIVHFKNFFVGPDHAIVIDADFADFIDDEGVFLGVVLGQDPVEQRRLAGAEITGQHRHRDFFRRRLFSHSYCPGVWRPPRAIAAGRGSGNAPALTVP